MTWHYAPAGTTIGSIHLQARGAWLPMRETKKRNAGAQGIAPAS